MEFLSFKRFKVVVLIGFIFFCFIGYLQLSNIKAQEENFASYQKENREAKFQAIKSILSENYTKAQRNIQILADRIVVRIQRELTRDQIRHYLDTLNDDNNPIIAIMAEESTKDDVYLNVKNDGNDPWIATLLGIISDFSADCSAEGRSRGWDVEIELHSNHPLAAKAIDAIKKMSSPDTLSGRLDNVIFWEFKKKENDKSWVLIEDMTLEAIHKVFLKYNGNLRSLETFEFLFPTYVYPKKDLADRKLIDDRGQWQGDSSRPLIFTQGFGLYDAIVSNSSHLQTMNMFDSLLESRKSMVDQALFWQYFALVVSLMMFVTVQLSSAHIVHIQSLRMAEEDKSNPQSKEESGAEH